MGKDFFDLSPLSKIRKVRWNYLKAGQIALGGIFIDGSPLPELAGYPVLTGELLSQLKSKYRFLAKRDLLIAEINPGFPSRDLSRQLQIIDRKRIVLNQIREGYFNEKKEWAAFPADYPLGLGGIPRGDTHYASFMKKILHLRDRDRHNKIILFTDGIPSDHPEAMKIGRLIKKNKVDYTQIVFEIGDEQRHEVRFENENLNRKAVDNVISQVEEGMSRVELNDDQLKNKMKDVFSRFTEIAEQCGGNQIILKINRHLPLIAMECYDRYLGALTLVRKQD